MDFETCLLSEPQDEDREFWLSQRLIEQQDYNELYKNMIRKKANVKFNIIEDETKFEIDKVFLYK